MLKPCARGRVAHHRIHDGNSSGERACCSECRRTLLVLLWPTRGRACGSGAMALSYVIKYPELLSPGMAKTRYIFIRRASLIMGSPVSPNMPLLTKTRYILFPRDSPSVDAELIADGTGRRASLVCDVADGVTLKQGRVSLKCLDRRIHNRNSSGDRHLGDMRPCGEQDGMSTTSVRREP